MTLQEKVTQELLAGTATEQRIFEAVWDWFVVQEKPKSGSDLPADCYYRRDDGAKCGFGIFIPDDRYDADKMEGTNSDHMIDEYLHEYKPHSRLFDHIQCAHDNSNTLNFTYNIRRRLLRLAESHNFTVPGECE